MPHYSVVPTNLYFCEAFNLLLVLLPCICACNVLLQFKSTKIAPELHLSEWFLAYSIFVVRKKVI